MEPQRVPWLSDQQRCHHQHPAGGDDSSKQWSGIPLLHYRCQRRYGQHPYCHRQAGYPGLGNGVQHQRHPYQAGLRGEDLKKTVTIIPAKPLAARQAMKRQLRVAAYCRVSTEEEEQQSSYEAQCSYYTDKIMTNPEWTMAGIFADEGITGTSAKKRPEFLHMIHLCKQRKIDLVLTKSISRFSRNTVDCLKYIRILRGLGIGVVFEKENINTLESDSELIITLLGAFAQSESESISKNVSWGIRQAMRESKTHVQFEKLYGYGTDSAGNPQVVPEEGTVVAKIYERFLLGDSLRMIRDMLNADRIPYRNEKEWTMPAVRAILTNEKYCGDVLMQKTYISDCISKKVVKNTGQLPMYLMRDNHPAIVSRNTYNAA